MTSTDEVEEALQKLFKAYDLDDSGDLSRDEFVKVEMRLAFEEGAIYKIDAGAARMTLADKSSSGCLYYDEFRERFLTLYTEQNMDRAEIIKHVTKQVQMANLERAKMGPRYHPGIRQVLRQIFNLFDASGDGLLNPEEWVAASKAVADQVSDMFDDNWLGEATFKKADTNGDGVLDMGEFLESSFGMFDAVKQRSEKIYGILGRVVKSLEAHRNGGRKETGPVTLYVQADEGLLPHLWGDKDADKRPKPEFLPPHGSWQDEGTEDSPDRGLERWSAVGETVQLPLNLTTAEEVASLVRLLVKLESDIMISLFYLGPGKEDGPRPIVLLRGERPGEGNASAMLQYFTKPNAEMKLFVKNCRRRPAKLTKQPRAFMEEREQLLAKRVGQCWGLDWETQLVGGGTVLPPRPLVVKVGDALVMEVPISDEGGEYRYVCSVFMDRSDVLSKPIEENIEPKKAKKKKKKAAAEGDPLLQSTFVALKEGKCVLFVDVSWEDQEEKLANAKRLATPCTRNSVARIGPMEVEVEKQQGRPEKGTLVWWNGLKWTNKKGPAKKKKR